MQHGHITLEREQSARLLSWGIRFFLTAALTASQTPGDYAPFALGCAAASGAGGGGIASLVGAGLGAALFLDFAAALPFLAAVVLVFTTAAAFRGSAIARRPWFVPATAAGFSLAVGGIYVVQSLSPLDHLTPCLAAAGLAGAAAWFFQPLLQPLPDRPLTDGILFLAAALLLALSDLELLGLSIGRMLLCVLLAYTAPRS